jgi:hypothetical protein
MDVKKCQVKAYPVYDCLSCPAFVGNDKHGYFCEKIRRTINFDETLTSGVLKDCPLESWNTRASTEEKGEIDRNDKFNEIFEDMEEFSGTVFNLSKRIDKTRLKLRAIKAYLSPAPLAMKEAADGKR